MAVAYSITINTSARTLTLYDGGKAVNTYPVGIGKTVTPTPTGVYSIASKVPNPGGPFGIMWLGLSISHYGIHGTNNPSSIGKQVSHGCIRMHNRDVLALAKQVAIGTPVRIIR